MDLVNLMDTFTLLIKLLRPRVENEMGPQKKGTHIETFYELVKFRWEDYAETIDAF